MSEKPTKTELVHLITQKSRFTLLMNILQHPEGLPTLYELTRLNPSLSKTAIFKHLQKLTDADIVEEIDLPEDDRQQGYPRKFYGVTEDGQQLLEEIGLMDAKDTLSVLHQQISDKPEKMRKYENAPRP